MRNVKNEQKLIKRLQNPIKTCESLRKKLGKVKMCWKPPLIDYSRYKRIKWNFKFKGFNT